MSLTQKDIKAIGEIIKKRFVCGYSDIEVHSIHCRKCLVVNDLADYFEKEDKRRFNEWQKDKNSNLGDLDRIPKFNREQFLKDCGVK